MKCNDLRYWEVVEETRAFRCPKAGGAEEHAKDDEHFHHFPEAIHTNTPGGSWWYDVTFFLGPWILTNPTMFIVGKLRKHMKTHIV